MTYPEYSNKKIHTHWNELIANFNKLPSYDTNKLIDELKVKNPSLIEELEKFKLVLDYPRSCKASNTHCFDKYLYKYNQNPNLEKFIVAKFEQSGGTFELCLFNYFSCRIQNNITVICLMNFNNQKDQLESRFKQFNEYLTKLNIKTLNIKYIRDFKKSEDIGDIADTDIIVCLYNSSSMKLTFKEVCYLAHTNKKSIAFAYDEIDIPESVSEKSKLKKIHEDILKFHPDIIKNIFGVSATTLGDIPGGFLNPKVSDIIFKPPSCEWSGIGHPDVKIFILEKEMRNNLVLLINNISRYALLQDNRFIGNLYIDIANAKQEKHAEDLAHQIPDLVIIVFNGTTSTQGGKFTIYNAPDKGFRYDTKEDEFNLSKCFELIKECLDKNTRNKFIFINHNMVLRGISIRDANLAITDQIVLKGDMDVASSSQKCQRIAGLGLENRRFYGLKENIEDILEYQKIQASIYTKCELESLRTPDMLLSYFINSQDINAKFHKRLSRKPTTVLNKSTGKIPISMNVSRYLGILEKREDLIPIIKKNIKSGLIRPEDKTIWKKVIKYIEDGFVNKSQNFILNEQAQSIIDKHWLLHYNNMRNNKGSGFSCGTDKRSKESKCYIGIMKNNSIVGYGECMVVFTDKTKNNVMKVE